MMHIYIIDCKLRKEKGLIKKVLPYIWHESKHESLCLYTQNSCINSIHASLRIIRTKTNQCKYMNWFLQVDGSPKKGLHDSKTKETTQKVMCIHFYL